MDPEGIAAARALLDALRYSANPLLTLLDFLAARPVVLLPHTGVTLKAIERLVLVEALARSHGVYVDAAKLLSMNPRVLSYKLRTHGLR